MKQIERLIEYFSTKGFKRYAKIEQTIGLGNGFVKKSMNGTGNLRGESIEKIQKTCPDLSMEWLLFGNGEMLNTNTNSNAINKATEYHSSAIQETMYKKMYDELKTMYDRLWNEHKELQKEYRDYLKETYRGNGAADGTHGK